MTVAEFFTPPLMTIHDENDYEDPHRSCLWHVGG